MFPFDLVTEDELPAIKKFKDATEDLSSIHTDVFSSLGMAFSEMLKYIKTLEKNIHDLNLRLIDNSPEHVELVTNFISGITKDIAEKNVLTHSTKLESNLTSFKTSIIKQIETEKIATIRQAEEINTLRIKLNTYQQALYWYSLPLKLIYERVPETHSAFLNSHVWQKITPKQFEKALMTSFYTLIKTKDECNVYEKDELLKPFIDEILFS